MFQSSMNAVLKVRCDSNFGCCSCIRAGLTAEPKRPKMFLRKEVPLLPGYQWIRLTFHGLRILGLPKTCFQDLMLDLGIFTNHPSL